MEVCLHRFNQELEHGFALLGAGGHRRPDPFQPAAARFASRTLGHVAVDHEAGRAGRGPRPDGSVLAETDADY